MMKIYGHNLVPFAAFIVSFSNALIEALYFDFKIESVKHESMNLFAISSPLMYMLVLQQSILNYKLKSLAFLG